MDFFLIFFCSLALLSSLFVVISSNPVHSVFFLILVFCFASFFIVTINNRLFGDNFHCSLRGCCCCIVFIRCNDVKCKIN